MDKKYRLIGIGLSACGIIGSCLFIAAALMGDAFPNPLRFLAVICLTVHVIGLLVNLFHIIKRKKQI